ncbi:putative Zn-dependent peptidase [Enterococcus sp. PF1-24]|uniref:EF-P 5-aminopentanol modification-associated protein YfmH n=1 Tax=unclassified Enterococcus TaxID=2608891 RepID=UPI002475DB23|nr:MULTISPECIES: pitrilysin family protein [unclassified Enterococcus]MDH6364824.1 putative Zn-dependent peptidase [Enterococcus sp. PFB1-1]MDH6401952.1 putative Zn-dependent peptidase [Enterococcus sp. PF1-24]
MRKQYYQQINEVLYEETLANGLKVFLLPKNDYHKIYGLFSTDYGSIDNQFVPLGEKDFVKVPDGIAHFLEHKMFEKEDGDVFQKFGQQGASANAFTSFTKTSYLFSTTDLLAENLTTLLDFVQSPYFTEETVEKEKGIIGQEIQMYEDDPSWRLFFGILQNMYPKHPLHIDIAGTIDSIAEITAEDLYTCYRTFYHPSNMTLFVVGNFEPEALMALIKENQASKEFAEAPAIQRQFPTETAADVIAESQLQLAVTRPKAVLGLKGLDTLPQEGKALLKYRTAVSLLLQLLIGNTSSNYLELYNQGLIDDSFGFEFNLDRGFHFADFSSDTDKPAELLSALEKIIKNYQTDAGLTVENLDLLKKKMLGKYFQALNSLEYIANQFTQNLFDSITLFDMPTIIQEIEFSDILKVAETFIDQGVFSRFTILPND